MTTTLSSKGQVVIPAEIRHRHQFRAGDVLNIEEREGEVVLKKAKRKRKKTLVQWMLDCPVKGLKIPERDKIDFPRIIKF